MVDRATALEAIIAPYEDVQPSQDEVTELQSHKSGVRRKWNKILPALRAQEAPATIRDLLFAGGVPSIDLIHACHKGSQERGR